MRLRCPWFMLLAVCACTPVAPEPVPTVVGQGLVSPRTALVGLRTTASGEVQVLFVSVRDVPFRAAPVAGADVVVEVQGPGGVLVGRGGARRPERLAEQPWPAGEEVLLVKVPVLDGREVLRVLGRAPDGSLRLRAEWSGGADVPR